MAGNSTGIPDKRIIFHHREVGKDDLPPYLRRFPVGTNFPMYKHLVSKQSFIMVRCGRYYTPRHGPKMIKYTIEVCSYFKYYPTGKWIKNKTNIINDPGGIILQFYLNLANTWITEQKQLDTFFRNSFFYSVSQDKKQKRKERQEKETANAIERFKIDL